MTDPNIMFFDIETTPILFGGWRLGKDNIRHNQVLKNSEVMMVAWAWNNEPVQSLTFDLKKYKFMKKDDNADYHLLKKFSQEYEKADLVVCQNGLQFDIPRLRSRLVKYKLPDLRPTLVDDLYPKTKGIGFLSHKQDYLGDYLGYGTKEDHGHDMDWWFKIMYGDKKILNKMLIYCRDDVSKMRKIYYHLKPYIKSSLNLAIWNEDSRLCPSCGKNSLEKRGERLTNAGKYIRAHCTKCNWWGSFGKNELKKTGQYPR